jgi:hypothetical protein
MLLQQIYRRCVLVGVLAGAALLVWVLPTQARGEK